MNRSFDTRLKKGLFPETPQAFTDGLLNAARKAEGAQNAQMHDTPVKPKTARRFPVRKILAGAAAAVLVAASIVIAVFAPGIGRNKHGAVDPAVNPLRGRWTLTEVEQNGETVDPETIGLQMQLQFSDESVTVSTQTGGAEGQYVYRYTLEDNAVTVTAEDAAVTVLPEGGGTYDPETDTLRFVGADGDGVLVFTREPDLVGKWTLTRIGELDPAALGVQYAEWMEFFADGTVTVIQLFNFDIEEETFAYTVYGKTVQIYTEGKTAPEHMLIPEQLVYDRETDTLRQKESNVYDPDSGRQDELIFSRTPNAIVWHSLVGKWTLTGIELYGSTGSPETSGLEMYLEFSDKESVTVTTVKETGTERQTYRWHFISGNEIMLTEKEYITSSYYTILYDAATDTLRMDPDGYGLKGMMIFSRVFNEQTLLGVWKQTRSEHAVDPSPLDGFDYDYLKWEKEQTWEEDAKPQPWYLEFTADGRMYYFLYAPDGGVQGNQSVPYTILGNTLQWSGWTLRYEAETDTICWIHPTDRREYYERVPEMEIVDPYRQKTIELRKQYPDYFDLDTSKGLKVYVWQMAESFYSCALISGTDERSEIEIGMMKGVTIEEMRLILSTYYEARDCDIEPEQIEVVPFHNPISSYWYEIDETYTGRVRWLLTGIPFECDDPLYSAPLDSKVDIGGILNLEVSTVCDVDGDGRLETCMLTYGPTSGLFTFTLSVYRNGTAVYRNTFQTAYGYFRFQRMTDGLNLYYYDADSIKTTGRSTAGYAVTIENGAIVLTDEETGETVEYWGTADTTWNMAVAKTPEERLEGLWCAMSAEEGQDGLLEIRFYQDEKRGVRCASFYESGILYDGYTYTLEEQESDRQDCSKSYLFTFANENGHERKLILYIRDHNEDEIDEDRTPWKDDSEQHTFDTFLKLTPITAEELPMNQDKYIFAGEGRVHYLDLVELNGDGEPVRVSVCGYTPVNVATGKEGESELTVKIGACEWKINEKLVMDSGIYIDLDPNDGHGNLLLSTTRADGTERTYELHLEKNAEAFGDRRDSFTLVCGHIVEGYCFLNDSEQQELMLGAPTDLLGAKYGYREVKGEALEPADEWLQASALIERVMFGKREDNIKDGMLLHLVRALPCEIDGKPATLEPGVYLHLREWHESMDRIVFLTEDDRWITVYLDGTAPYTVGGVPLADYFDNAPKG